MEISKEALNDISMTLSAMHDWLKFTKERFNKDSWERENIVAEMRQATRIIYQLEQILDSEH